MPRGLEPDVVSDFVLPCDRDKPKDSCPVFEFRYLSSRESAKADRIYQPADEVTEDSDSAEDGRDALAKAIGCYLVGWRNMTDPKTGSAIPYSIEAIRDVCTDTELFQLWFGLKAEGRVSADDKKKSDSQD